MKKKAELCFIIAGVCAILFVVFVILLKTVDVQAIGPEGTSVGFAGINGAFHDFTGWKEGLYNVTKILGILEIMTALIWAVVGLIQLIKGKSLKKVHRAILAAGGLYVIVAALYVLFEKIIINYRPVIMEGDEHVEASFPSTHTMIACVVMASSIILLRRIVKNKMLSMILQIVCAVMLLVTVFGRLFCGVHWLTDIIGGILISASLISAYLGVVYIWRKKKQPRRK